MFEEIFDQYRKAVDSSFKLQQDLYRQWMSGLPVKPPEALAGADPDAIHGQICDYQRQWRETLTATMQKHREALNVQYKEGIEAIQVAFRSTEAKTPEEYWRLTQEFWRKSIDSFKTAFEAQSKYVQGLAEMWLEMALKGKV
jgi:hypothetical protein